MGDDKDCQKQGDEVKSYKEVLFNMDWAKGKKQYLITYA
jgi:hypothetical protein